MPDCQFVCNTICHVLSGILKNSFVRVRFVSCAQTLLASSDRLQYGGASSDAFPDMPLLYRVNRPAIAIHALALGCAECQLGRAPRERVAELRRRQAQQRRLRHREIAPRWQLRNSQFSVVTHRCGATADVIARHATATAAGSLRESIQPA